MGTGDFHYCNNWRICEHRDIDTVRHATSLPYRRTTTGVLTEPVIAEGLVRYAVIGTCVQVTEEPKKK